MDSTRTIADNKAMVVPAREFAPAAAIGGVPVDYGDVSRAPARSENAARR